MSEPVQLLLDQEVFAVCADLLVEVSALSLEKLIDPVLAVVGHGAHEFPYTAREEGLGHFRGEIGTGHDAQVAARRGFGKDQGIGRELDRQLHPAGAQLFEQRVSRVSLVEGKPGSLDGLEQLSMGRKRPLHGGGA